VPDTPLFSLILTGAGIALLYYGGEHLVTGSTRLARALGMSPLVVGLTVVAFGTSAPELAASLTASLRGAPEIALANVVGSNIANLGLVLAIAAIIHPMSARDSFLWREVPFMIGVTVLLGALVYFGALDRLAGGFLLVLLALFLWLLFRNDTAPEVADDPDVPRRPVRDSLQTVLGILMLAAGARVLVDGAVDLAEAVGISRRVVGLTLVALGTSLPELATVIVAALKHETDLILGNLIGSNIFNTLCIMGVTLLARPMQIDFREVQLDLAMMMLVTIAILPMLHYQGRVGRKRGTALLIAYLIYIGALFA
jgi:cation:H+ antiporter